MAEIFNFLSIGKKKKKNKERRNRVIEVSKSSILIFGKSCLFKIVISVVLLTTKENITSLSVL